MKKRITIILILLLMKEAMASRQVDYCYDEMSDPYNFFSTKTAYDYIHPNKVQPENVPHCEPIQLWFFGRHGTRYPSPHRIVEFRKLTSLRDEIIRNHETGLQDGRLCKSDLENLRDWTFNITDEYQYKLAPQGEKELELLARRLRDRYPLLLGTPYSSDLYHFRYTKTQRTEKSAHSFAKGLFSSISGIHFPPPLHNDMLIKPYSSCESWKVKVEENPDRFRELTKFQEGPLMTYLRLNVSSRLGFKELLKMEDIYTIYDMCRYDKAWKIALKSPWCAVFSKEELKLIEYADDLRYYYYVGYGHQMNTVLGCPLIRDMMDRFSQLEGVIGNQTQPVGVFYFSHLPILQMLNCALGVNKDPQPLRADNYDQMQTRMWKLSQIGSFAANIEAVFFKCTEGDRNRVMFYQSERPMNMPDCDNGLCSWETVKMKFQSVAKDCNLNFCNVSNAGGRRKAPTWFYVLMLTSLFLLYIGFTLPINRLEFLLWLLSAITAVLFVMTARTDRR